jgi:hypothetical protein
MVQPLKDIKKRERGGGEGDSEKKGGERGRRGRGRESKDVLGEAESYLFGNIFIQNERENGEVGVYCTVSHHQPPIKHCNRCKVKYLHLSFIFFFPDLYFY